MKKKGFFTKGNLINGFFVALILVILFVPSAKAFLIRGFMEIGLFKPDVSATPVAEKTMDLSGIRFKDAAGKIIDLGDLRGKVVFLNFWATWCPPCRAEMPSINKFYEQFKTDQDVVFILVDADSDFNGAQQYMDKRGYKLPVYAAASGVPEVLFDGKLPTTLVFDKAGRVSFQESGAADYASPRFIEFIKKLKAN